MRNATILLLQEKKNALEICVLHKNLPEEYAIVSNGVPLGNGSREIKRLAWFILYGLNYFNGFQKTYYTPLAIFT